MDTDVPPGNSRRRWRAGAAQPCGFGDRGLRATGYAWNCHHEHPAARNQPMPKIHHSYQRLTARPGHPERMKIKGVIALEPGRVRVPGGPNSKQHQHPLRRLSGRKCGIVCLAASLLSLTLAADTVFGEEPSAINKPEKIVATDYASLQEAVDAAKRLNVRHLYMPPGTYDIDKTSNLTGESG